MLGLVVLLAKQSKGGCWTDNGGRWVTVVGGADADTDARISKRATGPVTGPRPK